MRRRRVRPQIRTNEVEDCLGYERNLKALPNMAVVLGIQGSARSLDTGIDGHAGGGRAQACHAQARARAARW